MPSMNKVFLMGNLTRPPEVRYTPTGSAVCDIGLAVSRRFAVNGQEREEVCFVDIVVWGKQAESCRQYLDKGSPILVEGRLQYDQWDDRETGAKRSRLRVNAERIQFLSRRSDGGQGNYDNGDMNSAPMPQQGVPMRRQSYAPQQQNMPPQRGPAPMPQQPQQRPQQGSVPPMPEEAFNPANDVEDDIPF